MDPVTLVKDGHSVVVTVPVEEHRLRSAGYRDAEPVVEPKAVVESEPEPESEDVVVVVTVGDSATVDDEPKPKRK